MENKIVSYETAKLAKEIGFDISCDNYFYYERENNDILGKIYEDNEEFYYCPEQSLLQKYLREKHNIYVSVDFKSYLPDVPKYYAVVKSIGSKNMGERLLDGFTLYSNYEEALEEGLFESLKLIIK